MEKFSYIQQGPELGNPMVDDTFFRSCILYYLSSLPSTTSTTPNTPAITTLSHPHAQILSDLFSFGQRIHTDLLLCANDAEENPPKLNSHNVYGQSTNNIETTLGWKMQTRATCTEGLIRTPYAPYIDDSGYIKEGQITSNSPILQPSALFSRVHAFIKNMMYTPSSGMHACPNAMTDGACFLLLQILLNPSILGKFRDVRQLTANNDNSQLFDQKQYAQYIYTVINNPVKLSASFTTNSRNKNDEKLAKFAEIHSRSIPFDLLLTFQVIHYSISMLISQQHKSSLLMYDLHPTAPIPPQHPTIPSLYGAKHPQFGTSGQWMTETKGGSDVSNGSGTIALPLSFPSSLLSPTQSPTLLQSDRLFALYGVKFFTSAIDSNLTITLARVITNETWDMAVAKVTARHEGVNDLHSNKPFILTGELFPSKKQKRQKLNNQENIESNTLSSPPHIILNPHNAMSDVYSCAGLFQSGQFSESINNYIETSQHTESPQKYLYNDTDHGTILHNLDPYNQIINNIPLTCFLVFIRDIPTTEGITIRPSPANYNHCNSHSPQILNNITINKLKQKLGTKQLPTAELKLTGTLAIRLSEYGRGVGLIAHMFNLSRLHNSVSACGYTTRLLLLNRDYMQKRAAFGILLRDNVMYVSSLAGITSMSWLIVNGTMDLSFLHNVIEYIKLLKFYYHQFFSAQNSQIGQNNVKIAFIEAIKPLMNAIQFLSLPPQNANSSINNSHPHLLPHQLTTVLSDVMRYEETAATLLRVLTPITKLSTAQIANDLCSQLTVLFGSLGYMEDSRIPRLFRDNMVLSIWEGTKQVCTHDFIRAIKYFPSSQQISMNGNMFGETVTLHPQHLAVIDMSVIKTIDNYFYHQFNALFETQNAPYNTSSNPTLVSTLTKSAHVWESMNQPDNCKNQHNQNVFANTILNMLCDIRHQLLLRWSRMISFFIYIESLGGGEVHTTSINSDSDNLTAKKSIKHTKEMLLEQHGTNICQNMYILLNILNLLKHGAYIIRNGSETISNIDTLVKIPQSTPTAYAFNIIFAVWRIMCTDAALTMLTASYPTNNTTQLQNLSRQPPIVAFTTAHPPAQQEHIPTTALLTQLDETMVLTQLYHEFNRKLALDMPYAQKDAGFLKYIRSKL